jgi:hypothetical protein
LKSKLEIALYSILRHELFHFAVDCMAANRELSVGRPVYWHTRNRLKNARGYIELEEALANAYMLRGLRHLARRFAEKEVAYAYHELKSFCIESQPEGYCDGPKYARTRESYITGCRKLAADFRDTAPVPALDALIFYPDVIRIDWRRCPIIIYDRLKLLDSLGISLSFFEAISAMGCAPAARLPVRRLGLAERVRVGRIVFWRENYHRAILDFCNNIGTQEASQTRSLMSADWGAPD